MGKPSPNAFSMESAMESAAAEFGGKVKKSAANGGDVPNGAIAPGAAVGLMDLRVADAERQKMNLLGDGLLRIGPRGSTILIGPTAVGKSSLAMQGQISWALGGSLFGLRASRELSSLYVQGENDPCDLIEMRDGIVAGLNLNVEQTKLVNEHVRVMTTWVRDGELIKAIEDSFQYFKPDLIVLDPLFAFMSGDVSRQEDVARFLRYHLQGLLVKHQVGVIILHHTGKPPKGRGERANWLTTDAAYAGIGSSELANWPRSSIVIRPTSTDGVFELVFGKLWKRAGIVDAAGNPVKSVLIRHSSDPKKIFWEPASQADLEADDKQEAVNGAADIFDAFNECEKSKGGSVTAKDLAKKLDMSRKTLNRRFRGSGRIQHGGETLEWRWGKISKVNGDGDDD
jgi:AAA domain